MPQPFDVSWCRSQFPALTRAVDRQPAVFFDGPAGSQVPQCVIDAVGDYLAHTNANHGGLFATSRQSDELLDGLAAQRKIRVWGITDPDRLDERVPTVSTTHADRSPLELAGFLADRGIFVWHGNCYALPVTEALGLAPEGMVRVGLLHYNTVAEVDRLLAALKEFE